jgi:DNA-binding protein WhiA
MQTFSEKVKDELTHFEYDEDAMRAILSSYLSNNLIISFNNDGEVWELKSQFQSIIKLIASFFKQLYDVKYIFSYTAIKSLNQHRTYKLTVTGNFKQINKDLELGLKTPNQIIKKIINRRAYLVGAFLSGGSISSIDKSIYHLEIRSTKINYLRLIQKVLLDFNISITLLRRQKNFVLYIKKANDVSDFLKIIGANNCMHELEDKIIARDYYTNVQRLNNLDIANLHKSSLAGIQQVKMINQIKAMKEFEASSEKFKFYCSIRLQNPEASLSEIVKIFHQKYNSNITRAGINHYVMRIKCLFTLVNKHHN